MFRITAQWWVCDEYSCYNEWETLDPTSFTDGLNRTVDMLVNPDGHQVAFNEDAPEEMSTVLNYWKGIFLVHDERNTWDYPDDWADADIRPLPLR